MTMSKLCTQNAGSASKILMWPMQMSKRITNLALSCLSTACSASRRVCAQVPCTALQSKTCNAPWCSNSKAKRNNSIGITSSISLSTRTQNCSRISIASIRMRRSERISSADGTSTGLATWKACSRVWTQPKRKYSLQIGGSRQRYFS